MLPIRMLGITGFAMNPKTAETISDPTIANFPIGSSGCVISHCLNKTVGFGHSGYSSLLLTMVAMAATIDAIKPTVDWIAAAMS